MSEASPPQGPDPSMDLRHLERIEAEVSRHQQNAWRVRLSVLALVAGFVALHGNHGRYMFLAPVLGLGCWLLDAHAEWNVRALRLLAASVRGALVPKALPMTLDVSPWASLVSWRSVLLRPARALYYHPLVTMVAYVAIDAPRLDPDGMPSELFWYLAVSFTSFLGLVLVAWSWWYDRFGAPLPPQTFSPGPTASYQGAPQQLDASRRAPDGPFPVTPRSDATRPFGTAAG